MALTDHRTAQGLLHRVRSVTAEAALRAVDRDAQRISSCTPLPDVMAMRHERADLRLFAAAGRVGLLDLRLVPCGGVTRVQRQYQRAPLYIYRPIYLDAGRPDMAFVFVLQSGDGLVQGDRYRVDIDCAPGAAAHITTQAATNVFAARQNFATQLVNLRAQAGAVLEYLPDPVVPFRGSRLLQRISLTADRESTVILGETLLPGRVAHGEAHVYDLYCSETEVCRSDGVLPFSDVLRLGSADDRHAKSIGLLGEYDVVATLYVISRRTDPIAIVAGCGRPSSPAPMCWAASANCPTAAVSPSDCLAPPRRQCRRRGPRRGTRHAWSCSGLRRPPCARDSQVRWQDTPTTARFTVTWLMWAVITPAYRGGHGRFGAQRAAQRAGDEAEFVDDAIDDDEVSPRVQLLLDRKELHELELTLDNPEGFADD